MFPGKIICVPGQPGCPPKCKKWAEQCGVNVGECCPGLQCLGCPGCGFRSFCETGTILSVKMMTINIVLLVNPRLVLHDYFYTSKCF